MMRLKGNAIWKYIFIYILTVAVLVLALIATTAIPNSAIYENMFKSAEEYMYMDVREVAENGRLCTISDNYADNILLNILWNMKSETPVRSAFDTQYYDGENVGLNWGLYATVTEGTEPNVDYTRYWHGMVVVIRPLLLWFTMSELKIMGLVAVVLLLAANIILLWRRKQYFAAVALPLSFAGVHMWWIVKSAEYQPAMIICLLMSLLYVAFEKKGEECLVCLSVITGVLVCFFDFLTTETMTILLPLTLVLLVRQEEGRLGAWRGNIPFMIKAGLAWGTAYGMTFLMKWILASLVLGENKLYSAVFAVAERAVGTSGEENLPLYQQVPYAILANLSTLFGGRIRVDFRALFLGLGISLCVWGVVFYLFRGDYHKDITILMLMLGVIPYIRYLVLNNHSYLHEFFTYRAQAVTILALLSVLWYNTDKKLLSKRKGRKR